MMVHYRLRAVVAVVVGLAVWSTPVAAHGLHAAERGISLPTVVAIAAILSISAGMVAAAGRHASIARHNTHWISVATGVVIVGLGVTAGVSVMVQSPTVATAGIVVGLATGLGIGIYNTTSECAELTAGAIGLHRLVEGMAVAGLWVAGTTVGLLGAVVFTSHMVVECVVIGMEPSFDRLRAVSAVILVTAVFVLGVGIGLSGGRALPTQWVVAVIGGMLIPLGGAKLRSKRSERRSPTPT